MDFWFDNWVGVGPLKDFMTKNLRTGQRSINLFLMGLGFGQINKDSCFGYLLFCLGGSPLVNKSDGVG